MKAKLLDANSPELKHFQLIFQRIPWSGGPFLAAKIEKGLTKTERVIVFLDDQDKFASFASLLDEDFVENTGKTPFISTVYVDPNYRGHNLSFQMVTILEQEAKKLGFDTTYIATGHIGLYEHLNYEQIDTGTTVSGRVVRILAKKLTK